MPREETLFKVTSMQLHYDNILSPSLMGNKGAHDSYIITVWKAFFQKVVGLTTATEKLGLMTQSAENQDCRAPMRKTTGKSYVHLVVDKLYCSFKASQLVKYRLTRVIDSQLHSSKCVLLLHIQGWWQRCCSSTFQTKRSSDHFLPRHSQQSQVIGTMVFPHTHTHYNVFFSAHLYMMHGIFTLRNEPTAE